MRYTTYKKIELFFVITVSVIAIITWQMKSDWIIICLVLTYYLSGRETILPMLKELTDERAKVDKYFISDMIKGIFVQFVLCFACGLVSLLLFN